MKRTSSKVNVANTDKKIIANKPEWLIIDETISELAYLTHSFFRYYGKFPSKLANILISKFAKPGDLILDNYVGSGTTMVEANLAGCNSVGVDINPLAVLASNVKTRKYNPEKLSAEWSKLRNKIQKFKDILRKDHNLFNRINAENIDRNSFQKYVPRNFPTINKWFNDAAITELAILKKLILESVKDPDLREFFLLGFSAIIRRTSKAYDAEVRPHVNPDKKQRPVFEAFEKKIKEMVEISEEFYKSATNTEHQAYLLDGRNLKSKLKKKVDLVISHPPYLNCFDYIPVYSLELKWVEDINDISQGHTYEEIKKMEIRSWPATNENVMKNYFDNNKIVYRNVFDLLKKGGRCCIVIGDTTIRGKLIPTHQNFIDICKEIGFELENIIYRTTQYGTGKYAYAKRSHYHNNEDGKRDAILILIKP